MLSHFIFFCEGILEKGKKVVVEESYKTSKEFQLHQKVKWRKKQDRMVFYLQLYDEQQLVFTQRIILK